MSTKKGQSSSTVKDVEALAARICSVYEIIAGQKLKYWEKHLKDLHWFQRLDGVSPESIDAEAKKYMQNLKTLKTALGENWPRFFCPDAKSLQDFGIQHNMDVSFVGNDGEKREITNVLLDEEADIGRLATAITEEINKQRVVARTLSNADVLPSRSPSVQPSPRGSSSVQPSLRETPGAEPLPQETPGVEPLPLEIPSAEPSPRGSPSPQPLPSKSPSPQPVSPRQPSVPRSRSNSVHLQTPGGGTPGRQDNDNPESNYVYVHNVDQNNLVYIYMIPEGLNSPSDVNNLNQDITAHLSTDIDLTNLKDCVQRIHDDKEINMGLCVVKKEEDKLTMGVVSMEANAVQTFVKFKCVSDNHSLYQFECNPEILTLEIGEEEIGEEKMAQAYRTSDDTMSQEEQVHDMNPRLDYSNENHAPVFVIRNDVFTKKTQKLETDVYVQIFDTFSSESAQIIAEKLCDLVKGETNDSLQQREAVVAVVKMAFNGQIDKGEAKCMVSVIDETPQGDIQALPVPRQGGATDSDDNNRASHILEHFNKQIVDDIVLWNSKKETETERIRNLENASNTCYFDVCIQFFTTNKDIMRVIQHFDIKHSDDKEVRELATNLLKVYEKQQIEDGQSYTKKLDQRYPVDVLRQIDRAANVHDQRDDSEFLLPMINIFVSQGPNELKQVMPQLKCKNIFERHLQPHKITQVNMEPTTTVFNLRLIGVIGKQAVELDSVLYNSVYGLEFSEWMADASPEYDMQEHKVTQRRIFLNAPEYLLLYADRNMSRGKKDKRNITMDFNDIKPFLQFECESKCIQEQQYELIYVTTHRGDTTKHSVQGSGHYISHYRLPRTHGDRTNDHVWYRLDDCERNKNNDSFDGPLAVQVPAISLSEDDLTWKDYIEQGSLFVLKKVHNEHRDKYRMFETYSTDINSEEADQIWMSDFAQTDLSSMTVEDCKKFLLTEERKSPHIFKDGDESLHSWVVESFIPEVLEAVEIYEKESLKELILDAFPHPNTAGEVGSIVLKYKANISNEKETYTKHKQWNIVYNVHSFIGTEGLNLEKFHRYNKFNARFAFNWMRPKIMMEHPEHKEAMNLIQECLLQHDITKCKKQIKQLLEYSWVLAAYKHKFLQKYDRDFANSSSKNININLSMMTNSDYFVPAILDVMGIPCTDSEMSLDAVREAYNYGLFHNKFGVDITYDEWKENARKSLLNSLQQRFNNQDFTPDLNKVLEDSKTHWNEWFKQIFKLYAPKDSIENYNKYSTENTIILSETGVRYFDAKFQEFLMKILDKESHFQTIITAAKVQWLNQHLPP